MHIVELHDDGVEYIARLGVYHIAVSLESEALFLELDELLEVFLELDIFFFVSSHEVPKHKNCHSEIRDSYDQLLCHREFHVSSGLSKIESSVWSEWSQTPHGFRAVCGYYFWSFAISRRVVMSPRSASFVASGSKSFVGSCFNSWMRISMSRPFVTLSRFSGFGSSSHGGVVVAGGVWVVTVAPVLVFSSSPVSSSTCAFGPMMWIA